LIRYLCKKWTELHFRYFVKVNFTETFLFYQKFSVKICIITIRCIEQNDILAFRAYGRCPIAREKKLEQKFHLIDWFKNVQSWYKIPKKVFFLFWPIFVISMIGWSVDSDSCNKETACPEMLGPIQLNLTCKNWFWNDLVKIVLFSVVLFVF